jgi:hypothetical protein
MARAWRCSASVIVSVVVVVIAVVAAEEEAEEGVNILVCGEGRWVSTLSSRVSASHSVVSYFGKHSSSAAETVSTAAVYFGEKWL